MIALDIVHVGVPTLNPLLFTSIHPGPHCRSNTYGDPPMMNPPKVRGPVFPFEIWTLVDRYIPRRTRVNLASTCKILRSLLAPTLFDRVTLTLVDSPMGLEDCANQWLLRKIHFLTSSKIARTIKFCRLSFNTQRTPSLPPNPDLCALLFTALAHFRNLTDLDCFRILFDERHVAVINSLPHLIRAEFIECQWVYRRHIAFEDRMRLQHLLVDHGPNKHRYQWLFNTHPDFLVSLVLTSGMPADFISGFIPPLPNLESLEINGIATLHPEFPTFMGLCPGLIELRITTDSLLPPHIRAAEDVMHVIPPDCIPDLRVYEGPAEFLPALTKGRLVTHVSAHSSSLLIDNFTVAVASAFQKQQVRSLKLRVPRVTEQILALISYFKACLAVEVVVTNENGPPRFKQTCQDVLQELDGSIFPPPPNLEYLSISEEFTYEVPIKSRWYRLQEPPSQLSSAPLRCRCLPQSTFIDKCTNLRYVMLSDDSGTTTTWDPQRGTRLAEEKTIRQWQRRRLRLFDPTLYDCD